MKKRRLVRRVSQHTNLVKRVISIAMLVVTVTVLSSCGTEKKTKYETAVFTVVGNSLIVPLNESEDGKGDAVKLLTRDGMSIYTSSFLASIIKSETNPYLALDYAKTITDSTGSLSNYEEDDFTPPQDNIKYREDFDKAIIIHNNHAVILPVLEWYEYNGEQLQILTPWKLAVLGTDYSIILIEDSNSIKKAYDFAKKLVGNNGKVTDFAFNYSIESDNKKTLDQTWGFNKAITLGDDSNTILPLKQWRDYSLSEEFQLSIKNSGTYFTSALKTLLISEGTNHEVGAQAIAGALNDNIKDLTLKTECSSTASNAWAYDLSSNFQNGIITNGHNSTILPLRLWNRYSGEKIKFEIANGVTILTSSMDSSMMSHSDGEIKIGDVASGLSINVKNIDPEYEISKGNNVGWFDTNFTFPYALEINDNSIMILSVEYWGEYSGGDQLQIMLAGTNTPYLTNFYDTKLVNLGNSHCSIQEVAQWFNDGTKNIVDLTSRVEGKGTLDSLKNISDFNYAIAVNGDTASIIPIEDWKDGDGTKSDDSYTHFSEKLRLVLSTDNTIDGDNTSIKLVRTDDREILDYLAGGLISNTGTINKLYGKELIYNKE